MSSINLHANPGRGESLGGLVDKIIDKYYPGGQAGLEAYRQSRLAKEDACYLVLAERRRERQAARPTLNGAASGSPEMRRKRVLAAWRRLAPYDRTISVCAAVARVRHGTAREILIAEGMLKKGRR